MPQLSKQSLLALLKPWQAYRPRESWRAVPAMTRGFYMLCRKAPRIQDYEILYLGFDGAGKKGSGIRARLKSDLARKPEWTHYAVMEVHDNLTRDEIRQLEALLRQIWLHEDNAASRK